MCYFEIFFFSLLTYIAQDETLEVKVYACENFTQIETGRTEKIYAVDILFGGEDSVIEYMLTNNLAKVSLTPFFVLLQFLSQLFCSVFLFAFACKLINLHKINKTKSNYLTKTH